MAHSVHVGFYLRQTDSGWFYLHWTENRRTKRKSTRTKDLDEAKEFLASWLKHDLSGAPTCGELWDFYYTERVLKKCVSSRAHDLAWKRMKNRFASLRPGEVNRESIASYKRARAKAPVGIFVELRFLIASWNFGVKRRKISAKDLPTIDELDLPPRPRPRERWLKESEVERLFRAAIDLRGGPRLSRVERFMHLALCTAGRRMALLELKWDQIDFDTRIVHLNPDGRAQTRKRRASVPISDSLLPVLRRAHAERISNFVFDTPQPLHLQLSDVAYRAGVAGVTPHVFRHTAATWMARRGASLWKIAKVLGNTTEEIDRTYARHVPDDLRDTVNLIGTRFMEEDKTS